jgi:hypothetical protein
MRALQVIAEVGKNSKCHASCFAYLPAASCEVCGNNWLVADNWYPTVRLVEEKQRRLYSYERRVTLKELNHLRGKLSPEGKAKHLPPGAGIGPIEARFSPNATDFAWSGLALLAAKPAIQKFVERGIIIPHGPVVGRIGNVRSSAYVAIELDRLRLCSPRTESALEISRCKMCGGVLRSERALSQTNADLQYEFVAASAPKGHGLVLEDVEDWILATQEFVRTYHDNRMTGLEFKEVGEWI